MTPRHTRDALAERWSFRAVGPRAIFWRRADDPDAPDYVLDDIGLLRMIEELERAGVRAAPRTVSRAIRELAALR